MTKFYLDLNSGTIQTEDPTLADEYGQLQKIIGIFPVGTSLNTILSQLVAIINQRSTSLPVVYEIQIGVE